MIRMGSYKDPQMMKKKLMNYKIFGKHQKIYAKFNSRKKHITMRNF